MTSPRYIILFMNTFRARDWERFGCDVFAREGFEILPVQTIRSGRDSFPIPVIEATERGALEAAIGHVGRGDLVLNLTPMQPDFFWLYRWLQDHRVAYAVMTRGGFPFSFRGYRGALDLLDWSRQHLGNLPNIAGGLKRRVKLLIDGDVPRLAPRWWLRAGRRPVPMARSPFPRLHRAQVLPMVHFDVEANGESSSAPAASEPYAVFLDQMMTSHPDFPVLGEQAPVDPKRYFERLGTLFAQVERDLKLPVLIAPHPKAGPDCEKTYGRPAIGGGTAAAVKGSSLVLCHDTTAVSFAVLNRRPVMFLTSDDLERSYIGVNVARTSSWLGQRRVNIDRLPQKLKWPTTSERDYARFETAFLRAPEKTLDWPEVLMQLAGSARAGKGDNVPRFSRGRPSIAAGRSKS